MSTGDFTTPDDLFEEVSRMKAINQGLLDAEEAFTDITFAQFQRNQVIEFIQSAPAMLDAKGADYADADDAYSNFRFAGMMMQFAVDSGLTGGDLAFMNHIATKVARICNLIGSGKEPKNEALQDSFKDAINYFGLWAGWQQYKHNEKL